MIKTDELAIISKGEKSKLISRVAVLSGEIEGVRIDSVHIYGPFSLQGLAEERVYNVLLSLKGEALVEAGEERYNIGSEYIVRFPHNKKYKIIVDRNKEIHFLLISKILGNDDLNVISDNCDNHFSLVIKSLAECPRYTEDIKSEKTVNRMILPEGMVPRFCMGSVETTGPDSIEEHDHPMLDQIFLGMEGCLCKCAANGESAILTENKVLHIPLGSKHSVTVNAGDKLSYVWMDFFLTLGGQEYMNSQHRMEDDNLK